MEGRFNVLNAKMSNIDEPVALITGGAIRLGAKIVRALHEAGYRVIIHYRSSHEAAKQLQDELNVLRKDSAALIQADFDQFSHIERCAETATATWQRLDVIINNASSFFPTEIGKTTLSEWQQLLNSNLMAPYFLVQSVLPYLQRSNGRIINIADIHGKKPLKGYGVYSIAKAGLIMLTKVLARELGPKIQVNAIAPSITLWSEQQALSKAKREELIDRTVLKHITDSDDIIHALFFLLGQNSMTGQTLKIDCGLSLK
jgi:pteridine reductase